MPVSATWTTPLDWATNYIVGESDMDTYVSNNDLYLYTFGCGSGTSFPGTPTTGQKWWRTDYTPHRLYYYTGSAWQLLVGNAGVRAYNSANISIGNAATQFVTFNSERYDTDNIHSTSSNTGRLTLPYAGRWLITAAVSFAANATGARAIQLWLNAATVFATTFVPAVAGGTLTTDIAVSTIYNFSANDYVELGVYQSSGGALNLLGTSAYSPEFACHWLGA